LKFISKLYQSLEKPNTALFLNSTLHCQKPVAVDSQRVSTIPSLTDHTAHTLKRISTHKLILRRKEAVHYKLRLPYRLYSYDVMEISNGGQRYTYRVLQTIQMKVILLCVWAERAVLGSAITTLKFKYEI
jgi:hypothetical protein